MRRLALVLVALALPALAYGQQTGILTLFPPAGGGGAGDITAVGGCTTGACFQLVTEGTFFAAPVGDGVATFRAITEADLPMALATDLELSAAITAHAGDDDAHHTWPLTDAEIPDDITVDLATLATTATTALAGDSATAFFGAGTIEHERGGLETDVSAFAGLLRISGGSTTAVSDLAGLNTALGSSIADGTHTTDTDTTCLDAGVDCLFAASATEGGAATSVTEGAVTAHEAALTITESQISDLSHTVNTDDQVASEVPITDTGGFYTGTEVETALAEIGPKMTDARTPTAHRDAHETGGSDPLVDLAGETITTGTVADARIAATISRDSEAPAAGDITGSLSAGYQVASGAVGITELADDDACAGEDVVRRNAGDTAFECAAASGGGGDSISAGDSSVTVVDAGTGTITTTVDGLVQHVVAGSGTYGSTFGAVGSVNKTIFQGSIAGRGVVIDHINYNGNALFCVGTGCQLTFRGRNGSSPVFVPANGDDDTGLAWLGQNEQVLQSGGVNSLVVTATTVETSVALVNSPASQTCTDSGTGDPGTLVASVSGLSFKKVTNSDADGCALTLSETGADDGQSLDILVVSNAGGTVTAADTAGIQESGSGCAMALNGASTWRYNGTAWIMTGCEPTN